MKEQASLSLQSKDNCDECIAEILEADLKLQYDYFRISSKKESQSVFTNLDIYYKCKKGKIDID